MPPKDLWQQQLVSSRLLEYEVWNRIHARQLNRSHGALRLGHWFGTSPEFWLNLQKLYELGLAREKIGDRVERLPKLTKQKHVKAQRANGQLEICQQNKCARRNGGINPSLVPPTGLISQLCRIPGLRVAARHRVC